MPERLQARCGQERLQHLLDRDRAGARTAAAVGRGKGLVQIEVHHVDAEIAGPRDADQRIHVGAVHVQHGALLVQDFGHADDVVLEDAERVRVGHHEGGDVAGHQLFQRAEIDAAGLAGLDVLHRVAGDGGGGRIGAVGRIRNQNLLARVAAFFEQRANQQDAGEFAVRSGRGLQRDRVHAGDLGQRRFQRRHDFHAALRQRFGLVRMRPGQAFGARHHLVDPRVVLHGAGAQRIHAVIDGVVPGGKAREVADGLHLADFGEAFDFLAHVFGAERFGGVHRGDIELRELVGLLAGRTALEEERFVLREMWE